MRRSESRGTTRAILDDELPRLAELLMASWGSTRVARAGRVQDATQLPGFVALDGDAWLGYVNYEIVGDQLEVVVLDSVMPGQGAGAALLAACVESALAQNLRRVWLVTTNDNLHALRFYQRRGWVLAALRRGAVDEARQALKPEIPAVGADDIPIRDELELELPRADWSSFVERHRWPST